MACEKFGSLRRDVRGEHLGEPFRAELAADAGEGRRVATGVAEIMIALEVRLTRGIRSALAVALMTSDAVERVQREVGGELGRSDLILLREEELQRGTLRVGQRVSRALGMVSLEAAAFVLLQGDRLRRSILREVVTGGTLAGDDRLTASDREILIRDDGDDGLISPTIAALELEQVAGDVDGILTIHRRLGHTPVGADFKRI